MQSLLAGLTFLIIGDSHVVGPHRLITTLHDDLLAEGAKVFTYGACGVTPSAWVTPRAVACGLSERSGSGRVIVSFDKTARTVPIDQLIMQTRPNVLIVEVGDPMADYTRKDLPRAAINDSVAALTARIRANHQACVWVGPSWGTEGGPFFKTYARVKDLSDYLKTVVAPCQYFDSLELSRPGEWPTFDGIHYTQAGYEKWGAGLTNMLTQNVTIRDMVRR